MDDLIIIIIIIIIITIKISHKATDDEQSEATSHKSELRIAAFHSIYKLSSNQATALLVICYYLVTVRIFLLY
jgi:chromate transport protein ChrA